MPVYDCVSICIYGCAYFMFFVYLCVCVFLNVRLYMYLYLCTCVYLLDSNRLRDHLLETWKSLENRPFTIISSLTLPYSLSVSLSLLCTHTPFSLSMFCSLWIIPSPSPSLPSIFPFADYLLHSSHSYFILYYFLLIFHPSFLLLSILLHSCERVGYCRLSCETQYDFSPRGIDRSRDSWKIPDWGSSSCDQCFERSG